MTTNDNSYDLWSKIFWLKLWSGVIYFVGVMLSVAFFRFLCVSGRIPIDMGVSIRISVYAFAWPITLPLSIVYWIAR